MNTGIALTLVAAAFVLTPVARGGQIVNIGAFLSKIRVPMDYQEIVTVESDKRGGQPCIRGLRITVYDVLSYLASGMTEKRSFRTIRT
jgi:hypothetical protein